MFKVDLMDAYCSSSTSPLMSVRVSSGSLTALSHRKRGLAANTNAETAKIINQEISDFKTTGNSQAALQTLAMLSSLGYALSGSTTGVEFQSQVLQFLKIVVDSGNVNLDSSVTSMFLSSILLSLSGSGYALNNEIITLIIPFISRLVYQPTFTSRLNCLTMNAALQIVSVLDKIQGSSMGNATMNCLGIARDLATQLTKTMICTQDAQLLVGGPFITVGSGIADVSLVSSYCNFAISPLSLVSKCVPYTCFSGIDTNTYNTGNVIDRDTIVTRLYLDSQYVLPMNSTGVMVTIPLSDAFMLKYNLTTFIMGRKNAFEMHHVSPICAAAWDGKIDSSKCKFVSMNIGELTCLCYSLVQSYVAAVIVNQGDGYDQYLDDGTLTLDIFMF